MAQAMTGARTSTNGGNPFTGFAEPGSFSASAGYEFATDPDISDRTKWIVGASPRLVEWEHRGQSKDHRRS